MDKCNAEAGTFEGKVIYCGFKASMPDGRCGGHSTWKPEPEPKKRQQRRRRYARYAKGDSR